MNGLLHVGSLAHNCMHFPAHAHACWEITYYRKGSGVNTIGGESFAFHEGTIVCQPPGVPHEERSELGFQNIHFSIEYMDDLGAAVPVLQDGPQRECEQVFSQMLHAFHDRGDNRQRILEAQLALLTEYFRAKAVAPERRYEVAQCERDIIDNLGNASFRVSDAIRDTHMSPTYFMKLFKRDTGYSPAMYLIHKRMELARRLLSARGTPDARVKDVALLCGYDDPLYFSRAFKKETGCSPEGWRRPAGARGAD